MLQNLILNQLVHNEEFFGKVLPHLKLEYFDSESSRIVFGCIDSYAQEYSSRPSPDVLAIEVNSKKIPEGVWETVVELVGELEQPIHGHDQKWLYDQTQSWMRNRAVYNVIQDSVEIYSNPKRFGELGEIPVRMEEALVVGFDDDLGMIYWEMAAEHYDRIHSEKSRIPFTLDILNKITSGGVTRKTLSAINAGINVGKTTALIDLAVQYASQGLNVVYFTFEVDEDMIRHRMDCRVFDRDFDVVNGMARHEYVATVAQIASKKTYGEILIKGYASGSAHTGHCRSYIKDVQKRRGITPDVILFDYIGEMASERLPYHMMSNTNIYYGSIARECRSLAFEFDAIAWTALQFQRGMQNTKEMTLDGQADSITIPKVLDLQLGISIPDEYASLNQAWCSVMKNRFGNKQKHKNFIIGLNNDKQKLYDVEGASQTFASGDLGHGPLPDTDTVTPGESVPGAPRTGVSRHKRTTITNGSNLKV